MKGSWLVGRAATATTTTQARKPRPGEASSQNGERGDRGEVRGRVRGWWFTLPAGAGPAAAARGRREVLTTDGPARGGFWKEEKKERERTTLAEGQ
ncbi:hypothetical protein NL676_008325 [Syzygium grande]|nr:hypothetical protein NL676_008325 [Syzygium grande]